MAFFKVAIKHFGELFAGDVIDIGSMDINGGPHRLISPKRYVGVDLAEGPNVTLVSGGQAVDLPDESFDVAMSSECFEHNPVWRETLVNMIRMTKPGGLVIFSCASLNRKEHGTTRSDGGYAAPAAISIGQEYYQNVFEKDVKEAIRRQRLSKFRIYLNHKSDDLYFLGIKRGGGFSRRRTFLAFHREYVRDFFNRSLTNNTNV